MERGKTVVPRSKLSALNDTVVTAVPARAYVYRSIHFHALSISSCW